MCSHCTADLRLCFRIHKLLFFLYSDPYLAFIRETTLHKVVDFVTIQTEMINLLDTVVSNMSKNCRYHLYQKPMKAPIHLSSTFACTQ